MNTLEERNRKPLRYSSTKKDETIATNCCLNVTSRNYMSETGETITYPISMLPVSGEGAVRKKTDK